MPRRDKPIAGQAVLGSPSCPRCGEQYAVPRGRRYIAKTRKTVEKWQCACGRLFEVAA